MFIFSLHVLCSRIDQTTTMLGDCLDHCNARGPPRPLSCLGTAQTTTVLVGLPRPLPCSGIAPTTAVLRDCSDNLCARGLSRPLLGEWFSSATYDLYSHTVERYLFRPCYKAHTSPSSKLGDYIGTMHLPVHLVSPVRRLGTQLNWEFFLDHGTMCLLHLLPGSGTKWAHFTLR